MPIMRGWISDYRPLIACKIRRDSPSPASEIPVTALIDTGSTDVMVQPDIAQQLQLVSVLSVVSHRVGISGSLYHDQIALTFDGDKDSLGFGSWTCRARGLVCEFDRAADIIIGMNVLTQGRLTIGEGLVEFVGPREDGLGLST